VPSPKKESSDRVVGLVHRSSVGQIIQYYTNLRQIALALLQLKASDSGSLLLEDLRQGLLIPLIVEGTLELCSLQPLACFCTSSQMLSIPKLGENTCISLNTFLYSVSNNEVRA
jgi:hypothetical protein